MTMPLVYLAGPINGCTDVEANDWRSIVTERYAGPVLNPMRRDYRGVESVNVAAIVEDDKADIERADIVLANCPQPSYGTAMEILYAWEDHTPVVVMVPADRPVSPWITYHAHAVVHSLDAALDVVHQLAQERVDENRVVLRESVRAERG